MAVETYATASAARVLDLALLEDNPGKATYASLLRQCGRCRALWAGKRVHSHMLTKGLDSDKFLGDLLVQMYGKCRSLGDAKDAFERLPFRDVFSWSIVIAAFAQNGKFGTALELYERMQREGVQPDMFVYSTVVGAYCAVGDLQGGQDIRDRIVERGMTPDVVVHNSLLNLYAKWGSVEDARRLFEQMQARSLATWNAMIAGYALRDLGDEAFHLFRRIDLEGLGPDMLTFINLLGACSTPYFADAGRDIHARVTALGMHSNLVLATALLDMYAKCGSIEDARSVFAGMKDRNQVSWNTMIAALVEYGQLHEAMHLYHQMHLQGLKPNAFTSASAIGACTRVQQGIQIHSRVLACGFQDDGVVRTALVNMYSKFGQLEDARRVFDGMSSGKDAVAWNAMMAAYTQAWLPREALKLLDEMRERLVRPDAGTYIAAANACSVLADLSAAKVIHSAAQSSGFDTENIVLQNSMLNMYARCGSVDDARSCFHSMPRRSVVSWNVLISCYVEQQLSESLKLLHIMDWEGIHPNAFTFSCVATACSLLKNLPTGHAAHRRIVASGFNADAVVVTALIDMYGRCGSVEAARQTFDDLTRLQHAVVDVVSWNAMLGLYSQHGQPREAVQLFRDMSLEGVGGNEVTLKLVLHACTHAGLVADALDALACGVAQGIAWGREHYACVVDVLGRAGKLEVAEEVVRSMPVEPGIGAWKSLLGACGARRRRQGLQRSAACLSDAAQQRRAVCSALQHRATTKTF